MSLNEVIRLLTVHELRLKARESREEEQVLLAKAMSKTKISNEEESSSCGRCRHRSRCSRCKISNEEVEAVVQDEVNREIYTMTRNPLKNPQSNAIIVKGLVTLHMSVEM